MSEAKLEAAIGAEIRRQRKKQDMTVAGLAEAAGLSQRGRASASTGAARGSGTATSCWAIRCADPWRSTLT